MDLLRNKKAYSMVELLISMSIFGVIMILFTNIILSSIKVSNDIALRGRYRESITELMDFIERDIKNSEIINSCAGSTCSVSLPTKYEWRKCLENAYKEYSICKYEISTAGVRTLKKKTPENIYVKNITFEIYSKSSSAAVIDMADATVIVTIEALPFNSQEELNDIKAGKVPFDLRQTVVSNTDLVID